jgi:hypothetical protein
MCHVERFVQENADKHWVEKMVAAAKGDSVIV